MLPRARYYVKVSEARLWLRLCLMVLKVRRVGVGVGVGFGVMCPLRPSDLSDSEMPVPAVRCPCSCSSSLCPSAIRRFLFFSAAPGCLALTLILPLQPPPLLNRKCNTAFRFIVVGLLSPSITTGAFAVFKDVLPAAIVAEQPHRASALAND